MIELAPDHKIGLALPNPVLIAAGCGGYGPEYRHLIDLSTFGALVTNPITLRPRRGSMQPRLVETRAGLVIETGLQNPGVKKIIRRYSKFWRSLKIPVIAHLPADEPEDLLRTARVLAGTEAIAAIEVRIPPDCLPRDINYWVRAIQDGCMLPVLAKLPLGVTPKILEVAANACVDALVIGLPPPAVVQAPAADQTVAGSLYGPLLHHLVLYDVQRVTDLVDLPVIAAGGVHSAADARLFLEAGARAVQIDTLLWVEPKQAQDIAQKISKEDSGKFTAFSQ